MNLRELSPEQKKYIAVGVLGLVLVLCVYFMMSNKNEEKQAATFEKPEIEIQKKEYESRIEQARSQKNQKRSSLSDYFGNENREDSIPKEQVYSEEEDPRMIELQRQIEQMEQQKQVQRPYNSTPSYSQPQKSKAQKKLEEQEAYRQKLIEGREEMLQHYQESQSQYRKESSSDTTPKTETIEIIASVYQDQYILPGDRVTLVLNNDLIYDNKRFPKGTLVYAFASMAPSRVFLEVHNIAHVPVRLVVKDITDGRMGLYSTRAGELWLEYKDEFQDDNNQELADAASQASGSSFIGSALKGLADFFKKKKIRKKDKILLNNDDNVILTNKFK